MIATHAHTHTYIHKAIGLQRDTAWLTGALPKQDTANSTKIKIMK